MLLLLCDKKIVVNFIVTIISDSQLSVCLDVLVMGSMMFSWEVFLLREVTEDWGRLRRPVRPQLDLAVMVAELVEFTGNHPNGFTVSEKTERGGWRWRLRSWSRS